MGLTIWRFAAWAENFTSIKRVKKVYITWSFSFRTEFPRMYSVAVSKETVRTCSIKKLFQVRSQGMGEAGRTPPPP